MPRTRREDRPVTDDLAEVKASLDTLLELVKEWERGQGDEPQLKNLVLDIRGRLITLPGELLTAAAKFNQREEVRALSRQVEGLRSQ
jgi:hypothetical protein